MRRQRSAKFLSVALPQARSRLCVWAFDLLHHNGRDLRELPLFERKARLEKLIRAANANWLRYSENFDDGLKLLAEADRLGLEGVVSIVSRRCESVMLYER